MKLSFSLDNFFFPHMEQPTIFVEYIIYHFCIDNTISYHLFMVNFHCFPPALWLS